MPPKSKPDPINTCRYCGKLLHRRRWMNGVLEDLTSFIHRHYCDRKCMALDYKGTIKVPNAKNSQRQSGKAVKKACERCGKTRCKLHVHHKDENPMNNAPENLQSLCASCHRLLHSPRYEGTPLRLKHCAYCSKPVERKGLCCTHLSRLKRYGDPLLKKFKTASGWILKRVASEELSSFRSPQEPLPVLDDSVCTAMPSVSRQRKHSSKAISKQIAIKGKETSRA